MLRHIRNSFRLINIAGILLGNGVFRRNLSASEKGARLARSLEAMGPSFVKLGQAFSTRSDLVGQEVALALARLQDKLPQFDGTLARALVAQELEAPLESVFSSFNEKAVAAASVAQVHFAVMHDGSEVAIKLLRPGIEKAFARDIGLFYWLAGVADYFRPNWQRLHLRQVVQLMEDTIRFETDLRMEAAAATRLRENLKHDAGFYVPRIYWELTARRMLVLERINGIPVSDVPAILAAGHDPVKLVDYAAVSFFNQAFRDGFFHADLHPGNLFVLPNGSLAVVDFGIMGWLDKKTRIYLAQILHSFLTEDYYNLSKVHFDVGLVPKHKSHEAFELALMAITKPIMGRSLKEISVAKLLGQLLATAESFEMEVQPHLLLLQKNMMITEGVGRMLNPDVNMWQVAEPLIHAWAADNLGPKAWVKEHAEETVSLIKSLPALVKEMRTTLEMERNAATLQTARLLVDEKKLQLFKRLLWLGWAGVILFGLAHLT